MTCFADALTPAPIAAPDLEELLDDAFTGWRKLARTPDDDRLDRWSRDHLDELAELEPTWTAAAAGDTLVHSDLRADNVLLTSDQVVVVDWPHACRAAAFVDVVFLAPSIAMQGGPQPADLVAMTRVDRRADRQALTAMVCALAGYFTRKTAVCSADDRRAAELFRFDRGRFSPGSRVIVAVRKADRVIARKTIRDAASLRRADGNLPPCRGGQVM